jgi:hypothetical protein
MENNDIILYEEAYINLIEAKSQMYYHATVMSNINSIKQHGIIPSGKKGLSKDKANKERSKSFVYVSKNKDSVWKYAQLVADFRNDSPVLVKLRIPSTAKLTLDQFSFSKDKSDFEFKGKIPKDWIVGFYISNYRSFGLTRIS